MNYDLKKPCVKKSFGSNNGFFLFFLGVIVVGFAKLKRGVLVKKK